MKRQTKQEQFEQLIKEGRFEDLALLAVLWKAKEKMTRQDIRNAEPRKSTMTRSDVEREYTVCNGEIMSKGKFDGEPVWAPYFWQLGLDGHADSTTEWDEFSFNINKTQRAVWPELGKIKAITLTELADGQVVTNTME